MRSAFALKPLVSTIAAPVRMAETRAALKKNGEKRASPRAGLRGRRPRQATTTVTSISTRRNHAVHY